MSSLTITERRQLENAFAMGGGYVLQFSDQTYREFFGDLGIEIDAERYKADGTSKAKRMRCFWKLESDQVVARVLDAAVTHALELQWIRPEADPKDARHVENCRRIVARLRSSPGMVDIEALAPPTDERDFEAVYRAIRESIERGTPADALDRLHLWVVKYLRRRCEARGIETTKEKPLHSLMGEYVKALRGAGALRTEMAERILKSNIKLLESFNTVRNDDSFAHDNPLLSHDEAMLIVAHTAATVRFMRTIETSHPPKPKPQAPPSTPRAPWEDEEIPF
jgi:hypothetical protein